MSDTQLRPRFRRRIVALLLLALTVGAGLVVHTALPDVAATDIAGDALYAIAVYLFMVLLAPRMSPLVVGAIAAVWCVGIELFQLTGIPEAVGDVFSPAMLVLGTVFDARDLVIYLAALAGVIALDLLVNRRGLDSPPARSRRGS